MTQEQDKALKVVGKLISDMGCHKLSAEEIMILIKGIISNDCDGCNWKYVQASQYQPGLDPVKQLGYGPGVGEVLCQNTPHISYFKNENDMTEEARKKLLNENVVAKLEFE